MTRILYVTGDSDFAALDFEEKMGVRKANEIIDLGETEIEHEYFICKLIEFGDIDPKFIDFIKDKIQDYDQAKNTNFYILN